MSALLAAEQRIVRGNSRNLFAACARLVIRRCLLWALNAVIRLFFSDDSFVVFSRHSRP